MNRRRNPTLRLVAGKVVGNEESVVKQITDGLKLSGLPFYRVRERLPGGGALSDAGIPDLGGWVPNYKIQHITLTATYTCIRSVPFYIEVKRPGRHEKRPEQIAFIERARADGCIAFFAQDWDDVVKEFSEFGLQLPH